MSTLKVTVFLVLLGMILARLVWMQLRPYTLEIHPRAQLAMGVEPAICRTAPPVFHRAPAWWKPPGFGRLEAYCCPFGEFDIRRVAAANAWGFVLVALGIVLALRLTVGAWIIGLVVGVVLLSRGAIMARLGTFDVEPFCVLVLAAWSLAVAHYMRTGALSTLAAVMGLGGLAMLYDPAFVGLVLVPVLTLWLWPQLRRGTTLRALRALRERRRAYRRFHTDHSVPLAGGPGAAVQALRSIVGLPAPEPPEDPLRRPYVRGGGLRTLSVPLSVFLRQAWERRQARAVASLGAVAVLGIFAWWHWGRIGWLSQLGRASEWQDFLASSLNAAATPWDLHLVVSLLVGLPLCLRGHHPADAPLRGLCLWLALGAGLCFLGALVIDVLVLPLATDATVGLWSSAALAEPRTARVVGWFESWGLALGPVGLFQAVRQIERR